MVLVFLGCTKTYTTEEIDKLFEPITSKYGIKIVYELSEEFAPIHVGGWRTTFNMAEPIDHRVMARYPLILREAFEKYPVQIIKNNLTAIYFAKMLESKGFKYGGTYDPFRRIVYLVNNGKQPDDHSVAIFHHEFSSILLKRHGFLLNPWHEQNPLHFKYIQETESRERDCSYKGVLSGKRIKG